MAAYQQCPHVFSQAKASGVKGFQRPGAPPQILCPFRLRPYLTVSKSVRAAKKAAGEDVWQTFFDGVSWVSTEKEDVDIELTWADWTDPSELEQLRRGDAVTANIRKGEYFAVEMTGTGSAHEKLGWCVYRALRHAWVLPNDLRIENKGERKEHSIPAGTLVIEGQPVVCERVTGGDRVYRRQVGREDNDHENDQTFASHLIVTKVREFVTRTHERDPDAQQVGGGDAPRGGVVRRDALGVLAVRVD